MSLFLPVVFFTQKASHLLFLSSFVDTRIRSTNYVIISFPMGIVYLIKIGESSLRGIFQVKHAQKHKLLESRKLVVLIDSCPGVLFWYFFLIFFETNCND